MPEHDRFLLDPLLLPTAAIGYAMSAAVARRWPDRYVLETEDSDLDIDTFLARVPCAVTEHAVPHPQRDTDWARAADEEEGRLETRVMQGHRTLEHEGAQFEVVQLRWTEVNCGHRRTWVAGPDRASVERLLTRVAEVNATVHDDEVMVFADGWWQRSRELRRAIRSATLEDLVLPPGVAAELVADFRRFLGARAEYDRFGVPWKRGTLFHGPPGNGKTHCVKALINALGLPCLYVQSFLAEYRNPQANVHDVFERARRTTPCVLVLEDLDALVTDATRSFFLNELDGFAANTGIVTLATTNHVERLDPAIVDRPSRFDRKVHFGLPGPEERLAYLALWNGRFGAEARLPGAALEALAADTDGFSYAYLKELVVSSLVRWMSDGRTSALDGVAADQARVLRAQMRSGADEPDPKHVYVAVDPP